MEKAVGYYRVSSKRQGDSGLGLEAQAETVRRHCEANGLELIQSFTEIESGRKPDRVQLASALGVAVRSGAVLVIARLDRLSRNVAFLSRLMEAKVEFVCCDYPTANRFTLHILAAVAEHESRMASERTKAALAAYKARGGLLGSARPGHPKPTLAGIRRAVRASARVRREEAIRDLADLEPLMRGFRDEGLSYREVATRLNALGHTTRGGSPWDCSAVWRVLERTRPMARRLTTRDGS
jgi:DNA invertase Pin-like site-specific DNA recombinase